MVQKFVEEDEEEVIQVVQVEGNKSLDRALKELALSCSKSCTTMYVQNIKYVLFNNINIYSTYDQ